jgi:signal peptidase I
MTALWTLSFAYLWALVADVLWIQPARRLAAARSRTPYARGTWSSALRVAAPLLIAVLVLRTFVVDAYVVPTPSMEPTLARDDTIVVNRLAYGLRSPLTGRALTVADVPVRGEIIAFRYPREPATVFVKRVIGVPGDRVRVDGRDIRVNGLALTHPWSTGATSQTVRFGSRSARLLADPTAPSRLPAVDVLVPPGHYFVLGDNLDHSRDSREWGMVEDANLVGRVLD